MSEVFDSDRQEVPPLVRTALLHGYVQMLADRVDADILHVKGAAVDPALTSGTRLSFDVDVLVRPTHVTRLIDGLKELGWEQLTGFEEASAFGHAVNLRHELGLIDVHRSWPGFGIGPVAAFDLLWSHSATRPIADVPCGVPSLAHQRLLLLLHHARSHGARAEDLAVAWTDADTTARAQVLDDADTFGARLALAAGTGDIEQYRGEPGYLLWKHFAGPTRSRWTEWRGRFLAAMGLRAKADVAWRFFAPNRDIVRVELGHEPSRADLAQASVTRARTATRELLRCAWLRRRR